MSNTQRKIYILERTYDGEIYSPEFFPTFKEAQNKLVDYFYGKLYDENLLQEFLTASSRNGNLRNVDFEKTDDYNTYPSFNYFKDIEIGHGYFWIEHCGPTKGQYVGQIKEVYVSALDEVVHKLTELVT